MKTLHTHVTAAPAEAVACLFQLEKSGRYEEAFEILGEIWPETTAKPNVENFEPGIAAELLLRSGALLGFLSHNTQDSPAQENSRNLLTEARERFIAISEIEKIAECENYLALGYWRTGELKESESWLNVSFSRNLAVSSSIRLYSIINRSVLHISNKKFDEILTEFKREETNFQKYADSFLMGCFSTNYGIALKNTGNISEALNKFELARYHHQKSRHKIYLGTVENNLAQIYKTEKCFVKAHEAIDRARKIFNKLKDRAREGFCLDTKALIHFDEGNLSEALETVGKAERILRKGENYGFLIETLSTKIKILLHQDDLSGATFCLTDAVQTANIYISKDASQRLIEEFHQTIKTLQEKTPIAQIDNDPAKIERENLLPPTVQQVEEDMLELLLPPALSHYPDIQVVLLSNNYLEDMGLPEGSLVIVGTGKVERGDLAAVVEKATDSVVCGFFDADFGIVCLETAKGDPQLFDEDEIEILGKIIGVSGTGKDEDGKMLVKEITF